MKTKVQKWGNSLGLRIPKAYADEAGLQDQSPVELSLVRGRLVVAAVRDQPPRLQDLLSEVTPENLHGGWQTGPATGREVW